MVSHELGAIFVHVPKCAGTSIESALGHFEQYSGPSQQDHRPAWVLQPVAATELLRARLAYVAMARQVKRRITGAKNPKNVASPNQRQWSEYYKFAVIRTPWGRLRSMYANLLRHPEHPSLRGASPPADLDGFVASFAGRGLMRPMDYWLLDRRARLPFDRIIRFEALGQEWASVARALGIDAVDLPRLNSSSSQPERAMRFSATSADLVRHVYAWEFETFGFETQPT